MTSGRRRGVAFVALSGVGALLTAAVALTLASLPATALTRAPLVIREGAATVATFDGIPGNNPVAQEVDPTPWDCINPEDSVGDGTLALACDVIPIKIVPPAISDADDWFIVIDLAWTPADQVEEVGAVNDLDMYFYDNLQVTRRDDPESVTYTQFAAAHSATQPESLKVFRPELGDYNLVVNNFSGPNVSYTVSARIETSLFDSPFEVLGPSFSNRPAPPDESADEPAPVDLSQEPTAPAPFIGAVLPVAPALSEVAVLPDNDFLDFEGGSTFDDQINAPVRQVLPVSVLRAPASPVSGIVLVFWFALVPLLLGGLVFFFVIRRNRVQLTA